MGKNSCYNKIVGTGGIGVGMLFLSEKAETLGRSESRPVILSKARDFCKQHIVLYYAATLTRGIAHTIPVGYVGDDAPGRDLLAEMGREGMDTAYVGVSKEDATMISVCLQYPDKEGCNITAINNAARCVTPEYVRNCLDQVGIDGNTIVAALPEVSIDSRVSLLKSGKAQQAFTALSVAAAEADEFFRQGVYSVCDLLAVNEEEACAILGKRLSGEDLVKRLHTFLRGFNPGIRLLATCGKYGAYTANGGLIEYIPPLPVRAANTAGAGDAFLGGTLAGLARGLSLQKRRNDSRFGETKLESAAELGAICAGMSVESEDSIGFHVTPESIRIRIFENKWEAEAWFIS
jgi:sugar/nucleoside kinase (ribokinase family)